ncbi:MAG: hypothetical protein LPD71_01645 [Shewanella sp.]|nr:hypothetical protein [Shewanella sp.]MCF1431275.1 hypothetical protein [Shewanella sp.]MCF1437486.1 hypothetical protein [Shewanella sp.]MCF1459425.1 hypothetical protein [Shewanella sp.]
MQASTLLAAIDNLGLSPAHWLILRRAQRQYQCHYMELSQLNPHQIGIITSVPQPIHGRQRIVLGSRRKENAEGHLAGKHG